jgi:Dolichyl-phosphate-mannose-protein mannosyltransferase
VNKPRTWKVVVFSDLGVLLLLAVLRLATLFLTNGQSGWHRDELDMLDNARHLAGGFVSYPPLTPFIARVALTLFGPSMLGVRLFSTLAHAVAMTLAGLMARELGGRRWAQVAAAVATAIAPYALMSGELFHYSSFDYLWWVLIAYLVIRLLKSNNPRWWLGIGAVIGVGMLTKYTIAYLVVGIVVGVVLTQARRHLLTPWLWGGVALAVLIVSPNLIWQMQHNFISLDFLRSIHARDVRMGRTRDFLIEQLIYATNVTTVPLWVAGLYFYFLSRLGRSFRFLGWMFLVPFMLFLVTQGRTYYFCPAYPMLFAGGAVIVEQWLAILPVAGARLIKGIMWAAFAIGGIAFALLALPIAPVNSKLWDFVTGINGELKEEIGWPELVKTVAGIYANLPAEEKLQTGIITGNYGEIGAIDLYGPAYGLPQAISGTNSYWLRGYGDPAPQTLIVIGGEGMNVWSYFKSCQTAGVIKNRYGVRNEESVDHAIILVCRGPRIPWPELWKRWRFFG